MEKHGPWKTLTTTTPFESPWIKIEHSEVITPGDTDGTYSVVHFKNYAAGIIPLDDEGNTWIVGQYRYPLKKYTWEMPEGGAPIGTSILESAKRELLEEVGLKANDWMEIQVTHLSNSATDEYGVIYLARNLEEFEPEPEIDEDLQIRKLPFDEFYQMILDGEITDSMTVMAGYKVKLMMLNGEI